MPDPVTPTTPTTPATTSPSPAVAPPVSAPSATAPAEPAPAAAPAASATSTTERPAFIPEAFWDAEKGAIKSDEFGTHFSELTAFKAAEDSRKLTIPESADKYELKLPETSELAEKFKLDPDDPMVAIGREIAHELGADQSAFEKIVEKYAGMQVKAAEAQVEQTKLAEAAQNEALGPKAEERRNAVKTFLGAKYGPQAAEIANHFLGVASAVTMFERIMRDVSGGTPGFTQTGRAASEKGISDDDWGKMTANEKLLAGLEQDTKRRA
jgi:hypothetical protein